MTEGATRAVAIGGSAGAVQALLALLPALPASYPLLVLVVVHVPPDRDNVLVPLFHARCRIAVREAQDKEALTGGVVYFAPSDYHLLIETDATVSLSGEEPVNFSRPSIDVLFETAADAFGAGLTGVILTGANHDGAAGLRAVAEAGGAAIVEDPAEAYSPIMPEAALAACPAARVMSLEAICDHLLGLGRA